MMSSASSDGSNTAPSSSLAKEGRGFTATLRRLLPRRDEARKQRALRWLGPLLEREWLWRLNRRTVATGAALGVFFGLLIPVVQLPFAAAGAVLLRANLPAAALGTLVSNPLTVGPIYWLAYQTGEAILDLAQTDHNVSPAADSTGNGESLLFSGWFDQMTNVGGPLMLGLAVFAVGGALIAYLGVRLAWRLNLSRRKRRHRATSA